jgi:uncharacterized protein YdhG (YjbR/CyaY superfamily)
MTDVIAEHLLPFDEVQRRALERTCATIASALPGAVGVLAYGMPTFKIGGPSGISVVGVAGFRQHNSLFPYSGEVLEQFADELGDRIASKGTIHFDRDRPFPAGLLRRILTVRIATVNASFPKRSGEFRSFHANGFPRETGRMRDGRRVGTWTTYDRSGIATGVERLR